MSTSSDASVVSVYYLTVDSTGLTATTTIGTDTQVEVILTCPTYNILNT